MKLKRCWWFWGKSVVWCCCSQNGAGNQQYLIDIHCRQSSTLQVLHLTCSLGTLWSSTSSSYFVKRLLLMDLLTLLKRLLLVDLLTLLIAHGIPPLLLAYWSDQRNHEELIYPNHNLKIVIDKKRMMTGKCIFAKKVITSMAQIPWAKGSAKLFQASSVM
jgi:hypothetical protein